MIVQIKNKKHKLVRVIKGYRVHEINVHNIVCTKTVFRFVNKYKRYKKVSYKKLKVFNSSNKPVCVGDSVDIGYLGKKITSTKAHTIVCVNENNVS